MKFIKKILAYYVLLNFAIMSMGFNIIHHHCDICKLDDIHLFEIDDCCSVNENCDIEEHQHETTCCERSNHTCSNQYEYHIIKAPYIAERNSLVIYSPILILIQNLFNAAIKDTSAIIGIIEEIPPLIIQKKSILFLCTFLL